MTVSSMGLSLMLLLGMGFAAQAQDADVAIVADAPNGLAVAGDYAVGAVAEVNDQAQFSYTQAKVAKYRELMELNGTSRNVRNLLLVLKDATRMVILERLGTNALTPEQDARFEAASTAVLAQTEERILNDIAVQQSAEFTLDEIQSLITANSSIAAAKYNAGKFTAPQQMGEWIQSYMVDAAIKIIKTFKESVES